MVENLYTILVGGRTAAEHMNLEDACLLIQAFMEKYFAEPDLSIELKRESNTEDMK